MSCCRWACLAGVDGDRAGQTVLARQSLVPTLLKFSVAPLMVVTALTMGLAISLTFVWFLPLVVAAAQLLPRQPRSAWDVAPRNFAVSLAVLSGLWGYPSGLRNGGCLSSC